MTHESAKHDALKGECVMVILMRRSFMVLSDWRWIPKTDSGVEFSCSERTLGLAGRFGVLRAWRVVMRLVAVPVQSPVSSRRAVRALTNGLRVRAVATSSGERPRAGAAEVVQCWRSAKRETGTDRVEV